MLGITGFSIKDDMEQSNLSTTLKHINIIKTNIQQLPLSTIMHLNYFICPCKRIIDATNTIVNGKYVTLNMNFRIILSLFMKVMLRTYA